MASLSRTWKYDVFPSFCGGDVRKGFLSHLMEKLKSKGIRPFIDDDIKRGQPIGPELLMDVLGITKSDDFVGMEARISEIKSKFTLQSEDVKIIGIVGPHGSGKTSTARALYNQLSPDFPFSTFIESVRESNEIPSLDGSHNQTQMDYQEQLLSGIFNQREIEVGHLGVTQEKLSDKKVLVVLDDVDSLWQLEK
ncbi:unnamed protein product, partial [Brassica oleracea]